MTFEETLSKATILKIRQIRELAELFGFESVNKFSIETEDGRQIAFAAEEGRGVLGWLLRQFLGHWRTFSIVIVDPQGREILRAKHPFRFYFQSLEVRGPSGEMYGAMQQRFSILSKRFDVEDATGSVVMTVNSPLLRLWTFPVLKGAQQVACVKKRWGGLLKEAFLDADTFAIELTDETLTFQERALLVAAGIFIDLQYFERKAR